MREIYKENEANYPRLKTDSFFADYRNVYKYNGIMDEAFSFVEEKQLLKVDLWRRFVQQFRENADVEDVGWRDEYWGKMMRGACFVYSYTKNKELYEILSKTVSDMIESADDEGRISTYDKEHEFDGWDIWGRKYVLLGMQYYLEICEDEDFAERIIKSMCAQADYIMSKIGNEDGKKPITRATRHWRGLNSSSLLEPIVRLYTLTKEKKYLDFAGYIVDCGGTEVADIFKLAYENELHPYQYPITKAYEMTSCFEGLIEYYRITKNEKHKRAVINFAERILEDDFTVIGCCGCTHELFDHSAVRQANTTNGNIMQETCVTVTLMKFFYQLMLLTGDFKYADTFEISLYNAYLGSLNTEDTIEPMLFEEEYSDWLAEPMPFSSYSPLTVGARWNGIGGLKCMSDKHYYGCCACIGAAGIGLVPKMHILSTRRGFVINLFISGSVTTVTPNGNEITFITQTDYPKNGKVRITVKNTVEEEFELIVRNPAWSKNTIVASDGGRVEVHKSYIAVTKNWKNGDFIDIELDMSCEVLYPIPYGEQLLMNTVVWGAANYMVSSFDREDPKAKNHIALRRGPVMLAQDSRLGYNPEKAIALEADENGCVNVVEASAPYKNIEALEFILKNGEKMLVTDYASAGKTQDSKMAVWMLTK